MTEASIGVGIIGLGRLGWMHALQLKGGIQGSRLVAAAVDPVQRAQLQRDGTAPCDLVDSVEELVARSDVDAVVVVSPTSFHREHIVLTAEAGKAIFAEKPVADSVADAVVAVNAVRKSGVPFQIGFQRRFDPSYLRAKELIDQGAIGAPEMFRGLTCDRIPPVEYLRTSGGLFWDLGIHDLDAARFLVGDDIVSVFAVGSILIEPRLAEFDDVDHGVVNLRFKNGAIGVIQCTWRAPYGYDIRGEVHGTLGKVIADLDAREPTTLYTAEGFGSRKYVLFVDRFEEAYRRELQAFIDCLIEGRAPDPGIEDALAGVLLADASTVSRREGRWVDIPVL